MSKSIEPLLLTEEQAAEALQVSRRTMFNYRSEGKVPAVKLGSRVMYDPKDLTRFIESHKVGVAQ